MTVALVAAGVLVSGCSAPTQGTSQGAATSQGGSASQSAETPEEQTPAAPDPSSVEPGTNHIRSSNQYAVSAATVQNWLVQGRKAKDYPAKKVVFLTFDDGPSPATTLQNLATMKKAGVHATYYTIAGPEGLGNQNGAQLLKAELDGGHAVAIHSYAHNYGYLYPGHSCDPKHVTADFDKADAAMKKVLGNDWESNTFRYPGGAMSWNGMKPCHAALKAKGAAWLDWNAMTADSEPASRRPTTPDGMMKMVRTATKEADSNVIVMLMHDTYGKQLTARTLPKIIEFYKSQGYAFGIIGEPGQDQKGLDLPVAPKPKPKTATGTATAPAAGTAPAADAPSTAPGVEGSPTTSPATN